MVGFPKLNGYILKEVMPSESCKFDAIIFLCCAITVQVFVFCFISQTGENLILKPIILLLIKSVYYTSHKRFYV